MILATQKCKMQGSYVEVNGKHRKGANYYYYYYCCCCCYYYYYYYYYLHTHTYVYIHIRVYVYIYICLFHAVSSIFDFITSVIKAVKVNWKDLEEKSRGLVKIQIRHLSGCVFR